MKKPKNRSGNSATARSTEDSSPGTLAINATRFTPCPSSSAAQERPSSAGSSAGSTQPAVSATCSAVLPACEPSAEKNFREKK